MRRVPVPREQRRVARMSTTLSLNTKIGVLAILSEIPCLLTRVITNTKGSVCPPAIRGEVRPSAAGRPRDGKTRLCVRQARQGRERPAARLRPRKDKG